MNRRAVIPISALITFGTIVLADVQKEHHMPNSREWLGFVIVFTMLSAGSDLRIPVAYGMAILVMVTVLLSRGPEALEFVVGKVKTPTQKSIRKPAPEAESAPRRTGTHKA